MTSSIWRTQRGFLWILFWKIVYCVSAASLVNICSYVLIVHTLTSIKFSKLNFLLSFHTVISNITEISSSKAIFAILFILPNTCYLFINKLIKWQYCKSGFSLKITTHTKGVRGLLLVLYLEIFLENVFNLYATIMQESTDVFIITWCR